MSFEFQDMISEFQSKLKENTVGEFHRFPAKVEVDDPNYTVTKFSRLLSKFESVFELIAIKVFR